MNRTRLSLSYLSGYLILIGLGLLLVPGATFKLLLSTGDYGEAMPRFAGMLMAGLGLNIAGIILSRAEALYSRTLLVRSFFLVCLVSIYGISHDPFFLVVVGIVAVGVALTLTSYLLDRAYKGRRPQTTGN